MSRLTSLAVVSTLLLSAPLWTPHDPAVQYRSSPWAPPTLSAATAAASAPEEPVPARGFWFGTDQFGRDLFSRFAMGARTSLLAAALAAALSITLALAVGLACGVFGGIADAFLLFVSDSTAAAPWLLVAIALRAALPLDLPAGTGLLLMAVVIGAASWPRPARHVRATVASLVTQDFVVAARAAGASTWDLMRRHMAPHLTALALERFVVLLPRAMMAEVTLSALGFGVTEPTPSWGTLVASVQRAAVLGMYWWTLLPLVGMIGSLWWLTRLADQLRVASRIPT